MRYKLPFQLRQRKHGINQRASLEGSEDEELKVEVVISRGVRKWDAGEDGRWFMSTCPLSVTLIKSSVVDQCFHLQRRRHTASKCQHAGFSSGLSESKSSGL